jgi:hypothetical protein
MIQRKPSLDPTVTKTLHPLPSLASVASAPTLGFSDFEGIEDEIDAGTIAGIVVGCLIGMTLTVFGAFLLNKVIRDSNDRSTSRMASTYSPDEHQRRWIPPSLYAHEPLLRDSSSRRSSLRPCSNYGAIPGLEEPHDHAAVPSTPSIRAENMVGRHVVCPELPL